ncbi:hypothetical protein [Chryseobacterium luteum]|uniref:Uncharacterized protein n=1 Tax=Chryseobacterium luteum TaxID=421531 RepID=A0A085ZVV1_9FLAO|nr:hypothetical protein [Chryseobacterium luteum]KFF08565.1 hypothetical protein IX38_03690 [Chryseobacterium luteum]
MEENQVKPFQKYSSEVHTYQVENTLEVRFGETKGFHSSCRVTLQETENEDQTRDWLIEKIEDTPLPSENNFMEILHELEKSSYPVKIKVDEKGVFLNATDHQKNIESWKQKTEGIHEKYPNCDLFRSQYLAAFEDEELFYKNKLKEPFWNLLFFAPSYVDNGGENQESITWNIKGTGNIQCSGIIRAEQRDYGFEAFFTSQTVVPDTIKEEINKKYSRQAGPYKAELTIQMQYNSRKKQYAKKKADFILSDGDEIVYQETSSII